MQCEISPEALARLLAAMQEIKLMAPIIENILSSKLFWVTSCQWAIFLPLVALVQRQIKWRSSRSPLLVAAIDMGLLFAVGAIVIAAPLYFFGLLPIPAADERPAFVSGFVIGGLMSLLLKRLIPQSDH